MTAVASTTPSSHAHVHAPVRSGDRCFNFGAGPSVLPDEVIRQIQQDIWNYAGSGMGILEHSHRAKHFDAMLAQTFADVREIAAVPANYQILFMTGGATSQSYIVPMNLLPKGETADYLETGYWAQRSIEDAKQHGTINVAATSKADNFSYIPSAAETRWSPKAAYAHFTSNNTIYGTQFHAEPTPPAGVPLVCDASSDIYSRPFDVTKYGMIYAGAQKNMGTAGATVVIIRDDLIERGRTDIARMLQYRTFAKEESRPNTPPAFAIYTVGLMAKWIKSQGGLAALGKANESKARLIYDALDANAGFWKCHARTCCRSLMNITFRAPTPALDDAFMAECKANAIDGLKGHRATGGMRASTYNAMPRAGCEALANLIADFAKRKG